MAGGPTPQAVRRAYWQAAGQLLEQLRTGRGWTREELAERAGLSTELVAGYERRPERYPELEAWWRLTIALGVGLEAFLRDAERRGGARLLRDVRPPGAGSGPPPGLRGQTGTLPTRGQGDGSAAGGERAHGLSALIEQLRHRRGEDGRSPT